MPALGAAGRSSRTPAFTFLNLPSSRTAPANDVKTSDAARSPPRYKARSDPASDATSAGSSPTSRFEATARSVRSAPRPGWVAWSNRSRPGCRWAATYSGVDTDNNFDLNTGGSYSGFGYPGSSKSNIRRIQEATGTASYQFLRSPDRGSGQFNLQVSWAEEGTIVSRKRSGFRERRDVLRPSSLQPAVSRLDSRD